MSTREERFECLMGKRNMTATRAWEIINATDAHQNDAPTEPRIMRLTTDQERIIITAMRNAPYGCILRVSEYPALRPLYTVERYVGERVCAIRRQIDELDQVTVSWL